MYIDCGDEKLTALGSENERSLLYISGDLCMMAAWCMQHTLCMTLCSVNIQIRFITYIHIHLLAEIFLYPILLLLDNYSRLHKPHAVLRIRQLFVFMRTVSY